MVTIAVIIMADSAYARFLRRRTAAFHALLGGLDDQDRIRGGKADWQHGAYLV